MIEQRMRRDLTAAMKVRDRTRMSALRTALAAIANAEAPAFETSAWPPAAGWSTEVERLALSDADRRAIIAAQIAEREDTVTQYERNGRSADAATLRSEITILRDYLE